MLVGIANNIDGWGLVHIYMHILINLFLCLNKGYSFCHIMNPVISTGALPVINEKG